MIWFYSILVKVYINNVYTKSSLNILSPSKGTMFLFFFKHKTSARTFLYIQSIENFCLMSQKTNVFFTDYISLESKTYFFRKDVYLSFEMGGRLMA